jgi:hypothetical protein
MPLAHTYTDAFLAKHITTDIETRAAADVADIGTLPAAWVIRLEITRAYVITAIEKGTSSEDTYAVKLGYYRKEWDSQLQQARMAQAAADAATGGASGATWGWGINLERC